jgi:hypothetical protein
MKTAVNLRDTRATIVLHSSLAAAAAAEALHRSIDEERGTLFSISGYKGDRPVLGDVSETTFRLQARRYWRNDFAPHFYGRFHPEPGGTRIEGYFDVSGWVRTFMHLWIGGVVIFGVSTLALTILDATARTDFTSGSVWVGIIVPPAMVLFGILLPKLGRLLAKGDERFILQHIQHTLAARIEEPELIKA